MRVRVCITRPGHVDCVALELADGARVAEALAAAGLPTGTAGLSLGIFGVTVEPDRVLAEGDRVEIYHALAVDPRTRRRERAAGRTRRRD